MNANPSEILALAQNWITALATLSALIAAALIAAATLYAQTRKKLHAVLRGVEESGTDATKAAIHKQEVAANIDLDAEIFIATGKATQKLKRKNLGKLAPYVFLLGSTVFVSSCWQPSLKPTCKEARITFEHLREDYEGTALISTRIVVLTARLAEIDAAISNLRTAEEAK